MTLASANLYARVPDFGNHDVVKRYAELVYHIAGLVSGNYYHPGGGQFMRSCPSPGSNKITVSGNLTKGVFQNCYDSQFELPITNGVMVGRELSDDVAVTDLRNLTMSFKISKTGFTANGKLQANIGPDGVDVITNKGNLNFTYNLQHGTWQHTITAFKYAKNYVYTESAATEEMFEISLSGSPYDTLSAKTIEPICKGAGNAFGRIVSGKLELLHKGRKVLITFLNPREILVEETGKKSYHFDWYGDPTVIFTQIPYELLGR